MDERRARFLPRNSRALDVFCDRRHSWGRHRRWPCLIMAACDPQVPSASAGEFLPGVGHYGTAYLYSKTATTIVDPVSQANASPAKRLHDPCRQGTHGP
jgi:hypothetical protein